jgi:protein ImuA
MTNAGRDLVLSELRARIERIELGRCLRAEVLAFGLPDIDGRLPGGGLRLGALHEVSEAGPPAAEHAALASLFVAGVLARLSGPVLWCLRGRDLFAPALARAGLHPDRVIYCETWRDAEVLPAMEEGLRHKGLAAVVGEASRLTLTSSRRLQLAAEASRVTALVIRRRRHQGHDSDEALVSEPTAALTRWRISPAPSPALAVPGLDRARWHVELTRCRGGEPCSWILEACDAKGRLSLPAELADRQVAPETQVRLAPAG